MKVLHFITRSDTIGGAQSHVLDMTLLSKKQNIDSLVVVGGQGVFFKKLHENSVKARSLYNLQRDIGVISDLRSTLEFIQVLKEEKPDIVALHSAKAGLIGRIACFVARVPCVYTAHGWSHIRVANKIPKMAYKCIEFSLQFLCQRLITVCENDLYYAVNNLHINQQKLRRIYNGVEMKSAAPKPCIQNETFKFITVARFQEPKDYKSLIESFSLLKEKNWALDIIGDGPDQECIEKLVEDLNLKSNINFLGFQKDVNKFLLTSDAFLLISKSEGLPISIIEAMKVGLPIIASDVGGISECVALGKNGFLIKNNNPKDIVKHVSCLVSDPFLVEMMGEESIKIFKEKFTSDTMFDATIKVYKEIVK